MWVGSAQESVERPVVNEMGHLVLVKAVQRYVENEDSGQNVVKLTATPSLLKPDANDVVV